MTNKIVALISLFFFVVCAVAASSSNHAVRDSGRDFFAGQDVGTKLQLSCPGLDNVLQLLSLASRHGGVPDVEDLMSHVAAVAGVDVGADACLGPTPRDLADLNAVRDLVSQQWDEMVLAASGMNKSDLGPLRPLFFAEEYETEYTNSFDDSMDKGPEIKGQEEQQQTPQDQQPILQQTTDEVRPFVASPDLPLLPVSSLDPSSLTSAAIESMVDLRDSSSSDTGGSSVEEDIVVSENEGEDDEMNLIISLARAHAGAVSEVSAPAPTTAVTQTHISSPLSPSLRHNQLEEPADEDNFFDESVKGILSSHVSPLPHFASHTAHDANHSAISASHESDNVASAHHIMPPHETDEDLSDTDSNASSSNGVSSSGSRSSSSSLSLSLNDLASPVALEKSGASHALSEDAAAVQSPVLSLVDAARAVAATPAAKAEVLVLHGLRLLLGAIFSDTAYDRLRLYWLQLRHEALTIRCRLSNSDNFRTLSLRLQH
jgi:hypothetical protein